MKYAAISKRHAVDLGVSVLQQLYKVTKMCDNIAEWDTLWDTGWEYVLEVAMLNAESMYLK